ncbi:hypothetical protein RB195_016711 [Necator americanus]|uniref:Uncharacterized protein n=1 Tax=Necator americanus TaxID=51031 RepID=A0ABR1C515_NECAM
MWPEDHFTRLVENTIKLHDLDITTVTFIGLSMKYGMNTLNIALMLDMIAVMVLMETERRHQRNENGVTADKWRQFKGITPRI